MKLKDLFKLWRCSGIQKKYNNIVKKLKQKEKIKVIFLVRENQKWTYQSLYEEFDKSERFEPLVLVSLLTLAATGKDKTRNNLKENFNFFKKLGDRVDYAYKDGKYIDLKEFKPDIVFYDQSWDLPDIHMPYKVSDYALTCYSPYGFELLDCKDDYTQLFHKTLYRFYTCNQYNLERYESYKKGNSNNCRVAFNQKLDAYFKKTEFSDIWKNPDKFKIIYAPHHSLDKNGFKLSTFLQNGRFILELAKNHPETTWIFKPHPRFHYALLRNNIMSEEEIREYYDQWKTIGAVFEQGDYFDIFMTSDLMITDGCAFLAEYLPCDKPIVRLVNSSQSAEFNKFGKDVLNCCYEVHNNSELEPIINQLYINKQDTKKAEREAIIPQIIDFDNKSSVKIYNQLEKELK